MSSPATMTAVDLVFGVGVTAMIVGAYLYGYVRGVRDEAARRPRTSARQVVETVERDWLGEVPTDRRSGQDRRTVDRRRSISPDPDPLWIAARDAVSPEADR